VRKTTLLIPVRSDGAQAPTQTWRPATLSTLVEHVDDAAEDVLLVCDAPAALGVARAVRALARGGCAALLVTGPVTRWAVLVEALSTLPVDHLGLAPAVCAAVDARTRTRVVLSGVGALAAPNPSLGQHVRSWWPPSRFLVDLDGGVVAPTRQVPVVGPGDVVVARGAREVVPGAEHALPPVRTEITGARGWRARRWLEVSTVPPDRDAVVAGAVADPDVAPCPECGRLADRACLFCGLPGADRDGARDHVLSSVGPRGARS